MDPNLADQNNLNNPVAPTPHVVVPSPSQGDNSASQNNSGNPKSRSKLIGVLLILIIAVAIPLTVFVSQKQQNIKQNAATKTISPTPTIAPSKDSCGYPYSSTNAKTNIAFSESEVLQAFSPHAGGNAVAGQTIKAWYNDEHALTLGIKQVKVTSPASTTSYAVSPLASNPGTVHNPQTGSNILTGDQAGIDVSGRPMWPALFITDITTDPNNKSGDWQNGGAATSSNDIFGTWKAAVKTVNGSAYTVTPDADPAKNNWNLGSGSDTVPTGLVNLGYGTEIRWDVDSLGLTIGHSYRFQFMVHDGDQLKTGGDVGEACTTIIATPPTITLTPTLTVTPTVTPTVTLTPTPTKACMVPNPVLNVKITCPNCSQIVPTSAGGNQ